MFFQTRLRESPAFPERRALIFPGSAHNSYRPFSGDLPTSVLITAELPQRPKQEDRIAPARVSGIVYQTDYSDRFPYPFFNSRFRIFPAGLLGSSFTTIYSFGTLKGDRRDFKKVFNSSGTIFCPGFGEMKAITRSPHSLSGSPATAHSSTSGLV